MFQRARHSQSDFTEAQTRQWLNWLACQMRKHSLTVFLIESLQPTWLPSFIQRWQYALVSRIASALLWVILWWAATLLNMEAIRPFLLEGTLFSILGGTVAGTVAGVFAGYSLTSAPPATKWGDHLRLVGGIVAHPLILGLLFMAVAGPFFEGVERVALGSATDELQGRSLGFVAGVRYGVLFGLVFGFKGNRRSDAPDIRLFDRLTFSIKAARSGVIGGGVSGALLGVLLVVIGVIRAWPDLARQSLFLSAMAVALAFLLATLPLGLMFAFFCGIFTVLTSKELPARTRPGQGLKSSTVNALIAGLAIGSVFALISATYMKFTGFVPTLRLVALPAVAWALPAAFWYGGFDVIQHLTLRMMLIRAGSIPRRFVAFLNHATRLVFLQRVGSGYIFVHRQLLDYFAETSVRPW
jgi:hypothetical protein